MSVRALLDGYRERFTNGQFTLNLEESIDEVVRREKVPKVYGVYAISAPPVCGAEILYFGKAGTVLADGTFKAQTIPKRLTMKQDGLYRREFFQREMKLAELPSLHFQWFETFGGVNRTPPFLAEAQLLSAFLEEFGRLPRWHRCA